KDDAPDVFSARHEKDWKHAHGEDKHADFSGARQRPPSPGEIPGQPAAEDRKHSDNGVNRRKMYGATLDIQSASLLEKIGKPDQKKPPDRIGQELRDDERPALGVAQQSAPLYLALLLDFVTIGMNIGQFRFADAFVLLR